VRHGELRFDYEERRRPDMQPESFVDAQKTAEFLSITRRHLLELARKGAIPAHALGDGRRRLWRFRLSELADSIGNKVVAAEINPGYGSAHKAVLGSKQESK
jgi:excisionase family DNA binding protein